MRSQSWLYCAAILSGFSCGLSVFAGENWEFPPLNREILLAAHDQPIKPPPDEGIPPQSDFPNPPGARRPWLVEDPSVGKMPTCATKDEALSEPNCGCDDIQYCCCPPTWLVRAEALIWTRAQGAPQVLATAPGAALNVTDLNSNWAAGPRITLQRQDIFGTCWDLELVYFGIDGFSQTGALAGATTVNTVPPILFAPQTVNVVYGTRIYNAEVNFRRELTERLTFTNGFRWLQFSENLNTNIGGIASHNVNVDNHLYGYQAGLDYRIWNYYNRLFLDGYFKTGIFSNSADQTTTIVGVGGALPTINAAGTHIAFVGEAGLYGGYKITERLRLLGGYNVLMLSGVANAPSQIPATNIVTGASTLSFAGTPVMHGATVGLEWVR